MGHGPRAGAEDNNTEANDSAMLINAMLKRPYPPISLPAKEFMENAKAIWQDLGLPALKPEMPWYGYSLGQWPEEFQVEAERAVRSEYWTTGDASKAAQRQALERSLSGSLRPSITLLRSFPRAIQNLFCGYCPLRDE
jgi:4-hydroxy-3-polyprenylbenzoate decarboxylase